MPFGADAEHQHVERGHRAVVLRRGRGGQPRRVPGGCRLRVVAIGAVRTRMDDPGPGRHRRDRAEPNVRRSRSLPRVAGREEPLVSPPDIQVPPVDGVPGRRDGEFGEHLGADAASGQHDRSGAARAATASTSLVTRRAATAWASSCASRCTITSGTLTEGTLRPASAAFPRRPRRSSRAAPRQSGQGHPAGAGPPGVPAVPARLRVAFRPSGRDRKTFPSAVWKPTSVIPGRPELPALDLNARAAA